MWLGWVFIGLMGCVASKKINGKLSLIDFSRYFERLRDV
jgi:hypothetical protein